MRAISLADYGTRVPLCVGGMTQTFMVEHGPSRTPLRLKQLLPSLACDPRTKEKWLEKAAQNAAFSHPLCVRVHDYGRYGDDAFLVTDHVDGLSLKARLLGSGPGPVLSPAAAVHLVSKALGVLAAAQAQATPLAHLNLDLDSILVRAGGEIMLTEFSMWDALSPAEGARRRFDGGRVHYLAPEVAASMSGDARSDVFSLGAILFELVSGQRAFQAPTHLLVAIAITEGKRRTLQQSLPSLPEALCEIVETMMALSPDQRFQSASAALAALQSVAPSSVDTEVELASWARKRGAGPTEIAEGPASFDSGTFRHGAQASGSMRTVEIKSQPPSRKRTDLYFPAQQAAAPSQAPAPRHEQPTPAMVPAPVSLAAVPALLRPMDPGAASPRSVAPAAASAREQPKVSTLAPPPLLSDVPADVSALASNAAPAPIATGHESPAPQAPASFAAYEEPTAPPMLVRGKSAFLDLSGLTRDPQKPASEPAPPPLVAASAHAQPALAPLAPAYAPPAYAPPAQAPYPQTAESPANSGLGIDADAQHRSGHTALFKRGARETGHRIASPVAPARSHAAPILPNAPSPFFSSAPPPALQSEPWSAAKDVPSLAPPAAPLGDPKSAQGLSAPPAAPFPIESSRWPAALADAASPALPSSKRGDGWRDPSKTLFQAKSYAGTGGKRGRSQIPLWSLVLLAVLFSFALVTGGVLLYRLAL